nr:GNAT family N-acetyltransferase [Pseudooceanicola onchidii]
MRRAFDPKVRRRRCGTGGCRPAAPFCCAAWLCHCARRALRQSAAMSNLIIRQAASAADMAAIRDLCRDYRQVLVDRLPDRPEILANYYAEADYEALLHALPEKHARPDGAIFVAELDGHVVGCGMTHRVGPETCEIKRVFTAEAARGHGAARQIFAAAMAQAKADGYRVMVLDTLVRLVEAIALYEKLGFTDWEPFYDLPEGFGDLVRFYGKEL